MMTSKCSSWLFMMVAVLLVGCASPGNRGNMITAHRWHIVDTPPTEPWSGELSQVYTYVLSGDIVQGASNDRVRQARIALGEVLAEVAEHSAMPRTGQNPIPLDNLNQFVIPARYTQLIPPSLDNYDIELAHNYLAWFTSALQKNPNIQAKLQGLGPFLIAIKKPFPMLMFRNGSAWKVSVSEPILVFDLSGVEVKSVPLYIREYKRIIAQDWNATSTFESWRADLASLLIKWGDALPRAMAATVQAGEILQGKPAEGKP